MAKVRRYAARRDANEGEIVRALEKVGASVLRLHDIDLLVGFRGRNYLLEVKDGRKAPSKRPLTPQQVKLRSAWRGHYRVVTSTEEAIEAVTE